MALATSSVESLPPSPRRVRVAAATGHVADARFAFGDDDPSRIGVCVNGGFQRRGHFGFLEPSERGIYRKRLTIHEWTVKRLPFRPEAVAHLEMFSPGRFLRRQSFPGNV